MVDEAIDKSASQFNLRDTIEDLRIQAVEATDSETKSSLIDRGT